MVRGIVSSSVLHCQWATGQRLWAVSYVSVDPSGPPLSAVSKYPSWYCSTYLALEGEDDLNHPLEILDELREKVNNYRCGQSHCTMLTAAVMLRTARKGTTRITCWSCCAAINFVIGIGQVSSSATTPSLGKKNTRGQVTDYSAVDSNKLQCLTDSRHCDFFGHRGWVLVLRVMLLVQSVESKVPIKHVPEKLKQSVILKMEIWGDLGW